VTQGDASVELTVSIDDAVPDGCIWLPTAVAGTEALGEGFAAVAVEKI
jgi:NADH-quinone oxidoreductase subunit G